MGLEGNHLIEFTVDEDNNRLFAVGSCGYTGGLSTVNLETDQAELLVPTRSGLASPSLWRRAVCGERIALGPDSLLVVGKTVRSVPQPQTAGSLLLLDDGSGRKVRTVNIPAETVDILVAPRP